MAAFAGVLLALLPRADAPARGHERLGRLFSSPEQRMELDRLRAGPGLVEETAPTGDRTGPEPRPEPERGAPASAMTVTVNGVVLRSDGHRLAWVNGVETSGGAAGPAGAGVGPRLSPDGGVRIRWPDGRTSAVLKPGQTLDPDGGVRDAWERRPPPAAPGDPTDDADPRGSAEGEAAAPAGAPAPTPLPASLARFMREASRGARAVSAPSGVVLPGTVLPGPVLPGAVPSGVVLPGLVPFGAVASEASPDGDGSR